MDDTFTVEVALGGKGRGLDSSVAYLESNKWS